MQRTPRADRKKQDKPRTRKAVNGAILGLSALLVAGAGFALTNDQHTRTQTAQAAATYSPPVTAPPIPKDERPRALFIGDSQTVGFGSSMKTRRWTALVSQEMGWREENAGLGGTGFVKTSNEKGCGEEYCPNYPEQFDEVSEDFTADVVVIAGGRNDTNTFINTPDKVTQAMRDLCADINKTYPGARIVAVGTFDRPGDDTVAAQMNTALEDAVEDAGGTYVDLNTPPTIRDGMFLEDNAHVDDAGHRAIAERVVDTLRD